MEARIFESLQLELLRVGFYMTNKELGRGTFGCVYKGYALLPGNKPMSTSESSPPPPHLSAAPLTSGAGAAPVAPVHRDLHSTSVAGSIRPSHEAVTGSPRVGASAPAAEGEERRGEAADGSTPRGTPQASDFTLGRPVAIKLVHGMLRERDLARAINEITLQDECSKGSIAVLPVLYAGDLPSVGFEGKCVVIVTDFMDVTPFSEYVKDCTMDEIRCYMFWLLSALARCHELGILHRDVKPRNFLYDARQKRGCLTDFGLAELESTVFDRARKQEEKGSRSLAKSSSHPGPAHRHAGSHPKPVSSSTGKSLYGVGASHDAVSSSARRTTSQDLLGRLQAAGPAEQKKYADRVLALYHASKCCDHTDTDVCSEAVCAQNKTIWHHVQSCTGQDCTFKQCSSTLNLLRHFKTCISKSCPVCPGVRARIRSIREKDGAALRDAFETLIECHRALVAPDESILLVPRMEAHLRGPIPPAHVRDGLPRLEVRKAGTPGYRAPEVLLGNPYQTTAIDTFAAGVIMASLLTGRYPFFTDKQDGMHLLQMLQLFGPHLLQAAHRMGKPVTRIPMRKGVIEISGDPVTNLLAMIPNSRFKESGFEDAFDLLIRLLTPDPRDRVTADAALTFHAFFNRSIPRCTIAALDPILRSSGVMWAASCNSSSPQALWKVPLLTGATRIMWSDGFCTIQANQGTNPSSDEGRFPIPGIMKLVPGVRPYAPVVYDFARGTLPGVSNPALIHDAGPPACMQTSFPGCHRIYARKLNEADVDALALLKARLSGPKNATDIIKCEDSLLFHRVRTHDLHASTPYLAGYLFPDPTNTRRQLGFPSLLKLPLTPSRQDHRDEPAVLPSGTTANPAADDNSPDPTLAEEPHHFTPSSPVRPKQRVTPQKPDGAVFTTVTTGRKASAAELPVDIPLGGAAEHEGPADDHQLAIPELRASPSFDVSCLELLTAPHSRLKVPASSPKEVPALPLRNLFSAVEPIPAAWEDKLDLHAVQEIITASVNIPITGIKRKYGSCGDTGTGKKARALSQEFADLNPVPRPMEGAPVAMHSLVATPAATPVIPPSAAGSAAKSLSTGKKLNKTVASTCAKVWAIYAAALGRRDEASFVKGYEFLPDDLKDQICGAWRRGIISGYPDERSAQIQVVDFLGTLGIRDEYARPARRTTPKSK